MTESFGAGAGDVYLIKTDSLGNVGIKETEERRAMREEKKQLTAYPNPFTKTTVISVQCLVPSEKAQITLSIYDVSGRLVKSFSLFTLHSSLLYPGMVKTI